MERQWLETGNAALGAMAEAIGSARESVCLETYIYADDQEGRRFLKELVAARARGVRVRVLVDALGSVLLSDKFWNPLVELGGEVRWFNPLRAGRWSFRNHRKLLVCDREVGLLGGFNIAKEYAGDGVGGGWRDLGMRVTGGVCERLAESFDAYFDAARYSGRERRRLRRAMGTGSEGILLTHSRKSRTEFRRSLLRDLRTARDVKIMCAYFLPTLMLRRALRRVVRRGGRVQLILPGKSDVALSQLATRSLYSSLLRAGIEVSEYQPQVLHAKLFIMDDVVYVGSANLDIRSLKINHEILLRVAERSVAIGAIQLFQNDLERSVRVTREEWGRSRGFLAKLKERWAYLVLMRVDLFLARIQLRGK